MKLSTKSKYGLKALYVLAEQGGLLPLSKLATLTNISEKYLEQILLLLRKADIVAAERGTNGGYRLNNEAKDIIIGDVLRALEDGLEVVECNGVGCRGSCACPTGGVWNKLYISINETLDGITLQNMLEENI